MATATILSQTQRIFHPTSDPLKDEHTVLYTFPTVTDPLGSDAVAGSVLTFDKSAAPVSFFALFKQVFKEKQTVLITTLSPHDTTGANLVDPHKTVIAYNADGTFRLYNPDFEKLSLGETAQVIVTYQVNQGKGAMSVVRDVTMQVSGTNEAPYIAAHPDQVLYEDALFQGQLVADDIDNDDDAASLTYLLVQSDPIPGFTFHSDGRYAVDARVEAYRSLAVGESLSYTFRWQVADRHGALSPTDDVTITVQGTNDAPYVSAALSHSTDEDAPPLTIDLLAGAGDYDHGAILHPSDIVETDGKGGWTVNGNTLTVTPDTFNDLNDGESETLHFTYRIVDEHGAYVQQTLAVEVAGITDAPSLEVVTSAGGRVNEITLSITSFPASNERVVLSFEGLPEGAAVFDGTGNDVTGGIDDYLGTQTFTVVLPADRDADADLAVKATGVRDNGDEIGSTLQNVEILYDVAASSEVVTFASQNQNMWGTFDGYIGWHEYIPFVGGEVIAWDETAEEWNDTGAAPWHSGDFELLNIDVDSEDVYAVALAPLQAALDAAIDVQEWTYDQYGIAKAAEAATWTKYNLVNDTALAWGDYLFKDGLYFAAKTAYDAADFANTGTEAAYNLALSALNLANTNYTNAVAAKDAAYSAWAASWYLNPVLGADYLLKEGVVGVTYAALGVAQLAYDAAAAVYTLGQSAETVLYNAMNDAYATKTAAYSHALAHENAMHDAGYYTDRSFAAATPVTIAEAALAWGEYAASATLVDTFETPLIGTLALSDAAVWAAQGAYNLGYNTLSPIEFGSKLQVVADLFAEVGLQVDFELDLGSVDTRIDYRLTSTSAYNQTTDMLSITPMMTNLTDGTTVAFDTISPNAKFYAALLYDVGVELQMLIDGHLSAFGTQIFDLSPGSEGISINTTISTNSWNDLLATIPEAYRPQLSYDVEAGKLVLIDFDSTEGGPYEVPFIEQLTEDILSIELNLPTVQTEGTATAYDQGYFQEGGIVSVDLSELTDAFLNLINARLDFSPELRELYNLPSLGEATTLSDAIASMATGLMDQIWDILDDGQSEGVPIFVLDSSDQTSSSLLHVNLFADDLSTITPQTASLGFYAAYGESDPVVKVNIDIDAAVAVIVNKVAEAILAATTAGATTGATTAIPDFNPLNISFGIDEVLEIAQIDATTREEIGKYIDLGFTFEAADLDTYAAADFSQEFTLSVDNMSYLLTMEDGAVYTFNANGAGNLLLENASSHDADHNGTLDYTLSIVPSAMFSNDTEIGLSLGYVLDFLKGGFSAGVNLPLNELLGITGKGWPALQFPMIDIGVGPMLRIEGDLDVLDVDVFEDRFALDIGSDTFTAGVDISLLGTDTTTQAA